MQIPHPRVRQKGSHGKFPQGGGQFTDGIRIRRKPEVRGWGDHRCVTYTMSELLK